MCTGIEIALLVGAGLTAGSQIMQANDQANDEKVQAHQMDIDAATERDQAENRANLIRKAGNRTRSNARAAYAAAGVSVDQGSPLVIDQQIATDVESDAWTEVLTGNSRARRMNTQADAIRRGAKNTVSQSYYRAGGTLLAGAGDAYKAGWSSQPKAQQAPAPIYDRSIKVNN